MSHEHDHIPAAGDDPVHAGHAHGPSRDGELKGVSDGRLLWTVLLNQILTVGQVVAGIFSGSVALLSDAAHNFNDANALLIAYIARRISRKRADERYTFGYRRAEMIGATINLTLLGVIGLYLVYEAVMRFVEPEPILGWLMAAAAGLALVVDVATALLLWSMSRGSLNVRAAFVHNIVDALGSVAVLAGAAAIIWLEWMWVDPVLTLLIAGYVLWQVYAMLPQATRVLMEGVQPGSTCPDSCPGLRRSRGWRGSTTSTSGNSTSNTGRWRPMWSLPASRPANWTRSKGGSSDVWPMNTESPIPHWSSSFPMPQGKTHMTWRSSQSIDPVPRPPG